jgi:hypothetical protein
MKPWAQKTLNLPGVGDQPSNCAAEYSLELTGTDMAIALEHGLAPQVAYWVLLAVVDGRNQRVWAQHFDEKMPPPAGPVPSRIPRRVPLDSGQRLYYPHCMHRDLQKRHECQE